MAGETIKQFIQLAVVCGAVAAIPIGIAWFDHRTRVRAIEVLRVYAERGEEPPASILHTLTNVSGWPRPARPPQTRGNHLAHAAGSVVLASGLAGIAWWRVSATGEAGPGVIIALLVALFFAGALAARLVYAYYATD